MTAPTIPLTALSPGRLCSNCRAWCCAYEDAYCGGCGYPCALLTLEVLPAVLPLGQVLPKVALRLTNSSCAPLQLQGLATPEWLEVATPENVVLAPGASRVFLAKADTFKMDEARSSKVVAQTSLGDTSVVVMVIPETPALLTSPAAIEYWPDQRTGPREYEVEVYPASGQLRVRKLNDRGNGWLSLRTTLMEPLLIAIEAPLKILVQFDPQRLSARQSIRPNDKIKSQVDVEYESPHGPEQTPLWLKFDIKRPPEITLVGEQGRPHTRYQTKEQRLRFSFTNATDTDPVGGRQNGRLEIRSAALIAPPGHDGVSTQLLSLLPLELAGGEQGTVDFQVNLQPLPPGIHYFDLQIATNRQELDRRYRMPVEVRAMELFEGIVAIDFGTSNTCCALLADGSDFESVPLDEQRTTAPTVVRYLDLSGAEPVTETGTRVKHLAAVDERVASSTLSRLKQLLAEANYPLTVRPMNSPDWITREAREAAADYLRHIRSVAEKRKNVLFDSFILTHPAVCSLQQYRNLRSALEEAFGQNAKIHFLQEPLAALVPFFHSISRNGAKPAYTVAAFDLGGGTTDITVVRVNHALAGSGLLEIRPEILASWGERFGGEDLTDFLVDEVKRRCGLLLQAQRPGYMLAERGVRGASTPSVRRNESALREWAEEFKASISQEDRVPSLAGGILLNVVPIRAEELPDERQFRTEDVRRQGEELEQVFVRYLAEQVARLAERLQQSLTGQIELDFIHLSGKTAFLEEVGKVLAARFKRAQIQRADDPKECVVRGACLWRSLTHGRQVRLVLPSSIRRTTSQIGILDENATFHPFIPLDQPIPDTGLEVEIPNFWDGQDRVVLWENLGVENCRIRPDGSRNPLIAKLGTWEPAGPVPQADGWVLKLWLLADFSLRLTAFSGNDSAEFRPVRPQR